MCICVCVCFDLWIGTLCVLVCVCLGMCVNCLRDDCVIRYDYEVATENVIPGGMIASE